MYHMVHGENPFAEVILKILGLRRDGITRYRDCWWNGTNLCIHTRTGGPNRSEAPSPLEGHVCYVRDEDLDYDRTYATYYFSVPQGMEWVIPRLPVTTKSMQQRWEEAIAKIGSPDSKDDPDVQRMMSGLKPLIDELGKFVDRPTKK